MTARVFLPAIPDLLQVCGDDGVNLRAFGLLLAQHCSKPLHLLVKRLAVILSGLGAYVTPEREHMAVLADVVKLRSLAETRDVLIERWIPVFTGMTIKGITAPVFRLRGHTFMSRLSLPLFEIYVRTALRSETREGQSHHIPDRR